MEMPHKNKKDSCSPLLVSTDCSNFKSLYLTCRRRHFWHSKSSHNLPANPISESKASLTQTTSYHNPTSLSSLPSPICFKDGREAAQTYWRRAAQLQSELVQLNKWLDIEKKLRDRLENKDNTYPAVIDRGRTSQGCARNKLMRLADGGYLHRIKKVCMPHRKLAMHVSAPAIIPAETGSTVSQIDRRPISSGSEEGFMEAIVLAAIEKVEILVREGQRIQMGIKEMVKNEVALEKRNEERVRECIVVVMLIQLRNPEKKYEAVEEIMIGLVEASVAQIEGNGFLIERVHVAGMGVDSRGENKEPIGVTRLGLCDEVILSKRRDLWSVSMRSRGDCLRNPDIVFAPGK